jgi:hypothetical protein
MSLYSALQKAHSEEDVKAIYIKALKLKEKKLGLIDIQTEKVWFEAKKGGADIHAMFGQLIVYVAQTNKRGEPIPPFLCVIDSEKVAFMATSNAMPILKDKAISLTSAASSISKETISQIRPYIEPHIAVFKIEQHEAEFLETVKTAIESGVFLRTNITPDNLKQVFDNWVSMVGAELDGVTDADYALLFFADIMFDEKQNRKVVEDLPAKLGFMDGKPMFVLNGKTHELASHDGYRKFWQIYHRPPEAEHRKYLLERRDSLLPLDERSFKGAYYTPLKVVDKAYDLLAKTLGKNWQQNYIVWDMCCGVGNLEVKHSNHRNIFMSTLDQADIDVMKASRTCVAATHFQYDYLNDDIDDFGNIDYSITNKLPKALQQAIADANAKKTGAKKILVLINPPYAESGAGIGEGNKSGVAKTKLANNSMKEFGKASNELFAQFVARIHQEMPNAVLAMFSKLKYVNAPNFEHFRKKWQARYLGGFVVHSKAFDGIKGNFPIGFLIWDTSRKEVIKYIETDAFSKSVEWVGVKRFYNLPTNIYLTKWINRPKSNELAVIPLKNAISASTKGKITPPTWSNNSYGYMLCDSNDMQHSGQTGLFSSVYRVGHDGGFFVNNDNFWQAAIIFAVRRLIAPTWLNDRDQFLQPTEPLTEAFKTDCLIWVLFNGSNLSASADGLEWKGKTWSIVNHFIPFTETEVNSPKRFESSFMVEYLADKKLSSEAKMVLDAGREIWCDYFATSFERKIRDEFKLNRADVGWYQIRKALEAKGIADGAPYDFSLFKIAYDKLSEKLRPQVFELGFLRS